MASIYDLTGEYNELYQLYEVTDDEQEIGELLARLTEIETVDLPEKAEDYARLDANALAMVSALKYEEKRLRLKRERYEALHERLKDGIYYAMKTTGAVKLPTSIGAWTIRKNPAKVEIESGEHIPEEYIRSTTVEYDKKALADALKRGDEIEGVKLVYGEGVRFS